MLKDAPVPTESEPQAVLESGREATRALIRNSSFYLIADTLIKLLSFIFNVYVVRQLGDERFGFYSAALAYAGIFSIIGDLGMTQYATREIARGRRKADDLFWDLVTVRLFLSLIAAILITASAYFIAGYPLTMVAGIFLVCVGFFFHAFWGPVGMVFRGHERIDYISVLGIIIQLFFIVIGTLVLLGGYNFYGLILASYAGVPVAVLIGAVYIKRLKLATLKVHLKPHDWLPLLKHSLPFALITFTILAETDMDTVMLSLWRSPEEVGWYKAAYNLIFKLLFIRGALLSTLTPQMSRYYGISKERVAKTYNTSFKILWTFSFPVAVGTSLLAKPLTIWLYTDEFMQSAIALAILIWALPLINLSALCGGVSIATDRERKSARVYTIAAIFNVTVNLIAIQIWGYLGAAVATVLTEGVILMLFYSVLHQEFPLTDLNNTLLKPFVAGMIMGGVIFILPPAWPVVAAIFIGTVTYIVALLALKPFNVAEVEIIQALWLSLRRRLKWRVS
jgi:O-antigen/teichoic acid export membrane protein